MEKNKYSVIDITNYIITKYQKDNLFINNLLMQKLLYYLKVKCLIEIESPFEIEGTVQKWKFGPVFPDVYHELKVYGRSKIDKTITIFKFDINEQNEDSDNSLFSGITMVSYDDKRIDDKSKIYIDEYIENMKHYDRFELVEMTHNEEIWNEHKKKIEEGIPDLDYSDEEIKKYFSDGNAKKPWIS